MLSEPLGAHAMLTLPKSQHHPQHSLLGALFFGLNSSAPSLQCSLEELPESLKRLLMAVAKASSSFRERRRAARAAGGIRLIFDWALSVSNSELIGEVKYVISLQPKSCSTSCSHATEKAYGLVICELKSILWIVRPCGFTT